MAGFYETIHNYLQNCVHKLFHVSRIKHATYLVNNIRQLKSDVHQQKHSKQIWQLRTFVWLNLVNLFCHL